MAKVLVLAGLAVNLSQAAFFGINSTNIVDFFNKYAKNYVKPDSVVSGSERKKKGKAKKKARTFENARNISYLDKHLKRNLVSRSKIKRNKIQVQINDDGTSVTWNMNSKHGYKFPGTCPKDSHFNACASICHNICGMKRADNPDNEVYCPTNTNNHCISTCECNPGFTKAINARACIPESACFLGEILNFQPLRSIKFDSGEMIPDAQRIYLNNFCVNDNREPMTPYAFFTLDENRVGRERWVREEAKIAFLDDFLTLWPPGMDSSTFNNKKFMQNWRRENPGWNAQEELGGFLPGDEDGVSKPVTPTVDPSEEETSYSYAAEETTNPLGVE